MDSINSSHFFDPNSHPRIQPTTPAVQKTSEHLGPSQVSHQSVPKIEKVETFSRLFDDSELERLQKNLESIADMAEAALKKMRNSN